MPESQLSNPRKRQNSERLTPQNNGTLQDASKRQKHGQPVGTQILPAFWDNLSKIDLTKRALKELDRRNTQAAPDSNPPYPRLQKKSCRPLIPAVEYIHDCEAKDLKDIKQTSRYGGLDLSDLRGLPEPSDPLNPAISSRPISRVTKQISKSASNNRSSTNTSKSTGPYNRNFQQNLIDGSVFPHAYRHPDGRVPAKPNNWEKINRQLSQPRPSLSPSKFSEARHADFVQADADASKEKQVTTSVIPIIAGNIRDAKCSSGGILFTSLDHLTDGTLIPGNPDIYYGSRPEQLDRRVRNELSAHIIPSTQDDLPLAPNFFVAAKGRDGSLMVADNLQSYGQEQHAFDNKASTISSIYHGGTLKIFTIHPSQATDPSNRPEYYMHQLNTWGMTGNAETFRQGAAAYRNARDWAEKQRDEAIRRANEKVDIHHAAAPPGFLQASSFASDATSDGAYTIEAPTEESRTPLTEDSNTTAHLQESKGSLDELVVDHVVQIKRSRDHARGSPPSRRKRRNAGDSSHDLRSQQSEPQLSTHSGLSQRFKDQSLSARTSQSVKT